MHIQAIPAKSVNLLIVAVFLSTLSYDVDQLAKNWVERTNVDDFDQANKSYNSF